MNAALPSRQWTSPFFGQNRNCIVTVLTARNLECKYFPFLAPASRVCHDAFTMARYNSRGRPDLDLPKARLTRETLREAAILFSYLRPYRGFLVAACGALILSSLLSLCFPFL